MSVQHTVQPLFPEWEHDGRGYQNRGAVFPRASIVFPRRFLSSLGISLLECLLDCSHTPLDEDLLRCSPFQ